MMITITLITIIIILTVSIILILKNKDKYNNKDFEFNLKYHKEIEDILINFSSKAYDSIYMDEILVWSSSGEGIPTKKYDAIKKKYMNYFENLIGEVNVQLFIKFFGSELCYYNNLCDIFDKKAVNDKILDIKRKQISESKTEVK